MPLVWKEVPCDVWDNPDGESREEVPAPSGEEESGGLLPWPVAYFVMFLSWLFEMHVVMIVTLPWWSILFFFALVDYALDLVFWLLFGWYCSFCAGVFVWIVNIVHLPITILGWIQRIFMETFGLIVDGWLLFLGNGCYLFFGGDCILPSSSMYWILDIPWFTKDVKIPGINLQTEAEKVVTIPEVNSFEKFWELRGESRRNFNAIVPGLREVQGFFELASKVAFAL